MTALMACEYQNVADSTSSCFEKTIFKNYLIKPNILNKNLYITSANTATTATTINYFHTKYINAMQSACNVKYFSKWYINNTYDTDTNYIDGEINVTAYTTADTGYKSYNVEFQKPSIENRIRDIIRQNMFPAIHVAKHRLVSHAEDDREIRARETLRIVIREDAYQRFLRRGFVAVKAKSGLTYTIFRGHGLTGVYKDGELIERICIDLESGYAQTDSLLARYFMILHDEEGFRNKANITNVNIVNKSPNLVVNSPNLVFKDGSRLIDHFRSIKMQQKPSYNGTPISKKYLVA